MEDLARFSRSLNEARNGSSIALAQLLNSFREYLSYVTAKELPQSRHRKLRPSSLMQETLLRACRDFDQFRGQSREQLREWLKTILMHCLWNFIRKPEFRRDFVPLSDELIAAVPTPVDRVSGHEFDRALNDAILGLPERYQQAVYLRHVLGLPFEQVGASLNCSAEAARKLWVRALALLAQQLRAFQ